jgi:eukaryotic-like serine/threonine-protein kinase
MSDRPRKPANRSGAEDTTRVQPGRAGTATAADAELKLPGFSVIRELGRGGMGQVFLARQTEPVERDVAIKLILSRIRNPDMEWRFQVERQALAQMHHPAIAQIFEAGTNPDGYPYFAMEYVPGLPLLAFCNEHRLGITERLELFIRICQGVAHAHQKGIVHRDLKPANILVSLVDDVPSPKIIDFGIATAAGANPSGRETSSAGTPVYMSPEQFSDAASVDTRSDIYALGVILCEMLTDQRPYHRDLFRETNPVAIGARLVESRPASPSALLDMSGDRATEIAASRQTSPARLARRLVGDLDAIALKAIEADREQRYANAVELVDELRCYLAGKPVVAMGEARGYRFRRFVGRHVWVVTSISLIIVALSAGLTSAVIGMNQAKRQHELAMTRQQELEKLIDLQQAMLGNMEPRRLGAFFIDGLRRQYQHSVDQHGDEDMARAGLEAFDIAVGQINPTDLAQDMLNEFVLDRAVDDIDREFAQQPLLQARLFQAVHDVYRSAGMIEYSLPLARRILHLQLGVSGPDATETLKARQQLYLALKGNGNYRSARAELDEILARIDPQAADQRLLRHEAWDSRANILVELGEFEEALGIARRNIDQAERELGPDHEKTVRALNTLGYVHARMGQLEDALSLFEESLARARAHFSPTEEVYYSPMLNVSAALGALGQFERALELDRETLVLLSTNLGRRNPSTLRVMNNMAMNLMDLGENEEARDLMNELVELGRETYGRHHPLALALQYNRADLFSNLGDFEVALEEYQEVAVWRERLLSADHSDTLKAQERVARTHLALGDHDEAAAAAELVFERLRPDHAGDHDRRIDAARLVAEIEQQASNQEQEAHWREIIFNALVESGQLAEADTLMEGVRLFELHRQMGQMDQAGELATLIGHQLDRGDAELSEVRDRFSQVLRN